MSIADKLGLGPARTVTVLDGGNGYCVTVRIPSWVGNYPPREVYLTADQYTRFQRWLADEMYIQDALSDLTDEQREVLMNGDPQ